MCENVIHNFPSPHSSLMLTILYLDSLFSLDSSFLITTGDALSASLTVTSGLFSAA